MRTKWLKPIAIKIVQEYLIRKSYTHSLRCRNRSRFQIQPASDLKLQRFRIIAISVAIPQGAAKGGVIKGGVFTNANERRQTRAKADKRRFQTL